MLRGRPTIAILILAALGANASAAPLALLERNGSYVAVEAYAPNIVRITLSQDKALAVAPAGYGFLGTPDATGWQHEGSTTGSGDVFKSRLLSVKVPAQPLPGPPNQMQRYFAPSLPPVQVSIGK